MPAAQPVSTGPTALPSLAAGAPTDTGAPGGPATSSTGGATFGERLATALDRRTGAAPGAQAIAPAASGTPAVAVAVAMGGPQEASGAMATGSGPVPAHTPAVPLLALAGALPQPGAAQAPAGPGQKDAGAPGAIAPRTRTAPRSGPDAARPGPASPAGAEPGVIPLPGAEAPLSPTAPATLAEAGPAAQPGATADPVATPSAPDRVASRHAAVGTKTARPDPTNGQGPAAPGAIPQPGLAVDPTVAAAPGKGMASAAGPPAPPASGQDVAAAAGASGARPAATLAAQTDTRPPSSPAEQLAAPMFAVAGGPNQRRTLTIRLDPEALGTVQIRIDRAGGGPARVEITAERPETLALLIRDEAQLQRTLDQAGIPAEGRSLSFHAALPDPGQQSGTPSGASAGGGLPQGAAAQSNADPQTGSQTGQGAGGGGSGGGQRRIAPCDDDIQAVGFAAPRWHRAGLDITA